MLDFEYLETGFGTLKVRFDEQDHEVRLVDILKENRDFKPATSIAKELSLEERLDFVKKAHAQSIALSNEPARRRLEEIDFTYLDMEDQQSV